MNDETNTSQHIMNTYNRLPVKITSGEGVYLYDSNGESYLDALSGIAVTGLGHAHPKITACIQQQASELLHASNLYHIPQQTTLAQQLTDISGLKNCFFTNSGAEANEALIKLARLYGHRNGIESPVIIVMERAFHGRSLATLSASGNRAIQAGFEPLVAGFIRVPFNELEAIEKIAATHPSVCAVLLEPIQGEGGIQLADQSYLTAIRQLCDQHNWLLALDEVQTGNGRTGQYFAYQHTSIKPDLLSTAKGLGNGFPIGVCLASEKAADTFQPGNHGSTFGGNPLACAVGSEVVQTLFNDELIENAKQIGNFIKEGFNHHLAHREYIVDIRGQGMMLGIELDAPCPELVSLALAQKLLINVTAHNVIRLLPPLTYTQAQAETLITKLSTLIRTFKNDDNGDRV